MNELIVLIFHQIYEGVLGIFGGFWFLLMFLLFAQLDF